MKFLFALGFLLISLRLYAQQNTDTTKMLSGGSLKEVKVKTPFEKWQKDSAENRAIHHKRLGDADVKFSPSLTWLAYKISGQQKRAKKFKAQMEAHEREMLFDIRYNAAGKAPHLHSR